MVKKHVPGTIRSSGVVLSDFTSWSVELCVNSSHADLFRHIFDAEYAAVVKQKISQLPSLIDDSEALNRIWKNLLELDTLFLSESLIDKAAAQHASDQDLAAWKLLAKGLNHACRHLIQGKTAREAYLALANTSCRGVIFDNDQEREHFQSMQRKMDTFSFGEFNKDDAHNLLNKHIELMEACDSLFRQDPRKKDQAKRFHLVKRLPKSLEPLKMYYRRRGQTRGRCTYDIVVNDLRRRIDAGSLQEPWETLKEKIFW